MIKVGVIGYGYWGPNLVRNFVEAPGSTVASVCDLRDERLAHLRVRYPTIKTFDCAKALFDDPDIDAIVVATPVSSHFEMAMAALKANKHVLVEKPLAANSEQGEQLIEEAARRKRVLMVDHTFVYTGAVRKIRELITSNQLGDIYYYDAVRVNLGLFQHDVNVIWDLAIHDLSIMEYVLPSKATAVSATGISHVPGQPENVAYITLFFDKPQIAHVHVNWLTPVKVRHTLIGKSTTKGLLFRKVLKQFMRCSSVIVLVICGRQDLIRPKRSKLKRYTSSIALKTTNSRRRMVKRVCDWSELSKPQNARYTTEVNWLKLIEQVK
jgi:predicted dehydrogenase